MRHQETWHRLLRWEKIMIGFTAILFRTFLYRRWRFTIDHIKLSYLQLNEQQAKLLAWCVLRELGITTLRTIQRVFQPGHWRHLHTNKLHFTQSDLRDVLAKQSIYLEDHGGVQALLRSQRGVIALSAHLGDFEALIHLSQLLRKPSGLISKRMTNRIAQSIWDFSRRRGPKRFDQGNRALTIIKSLKRGQLIADVLDQHDPRPNALTLSFLGRPAKTSRDLARMALLSDAIIIPMFLYRGHLVESDSTGKMNHTLSIGPIIDPRMLPETLDKEQKINHLTQLCVAEIEQAIHRAPEQWLWLHRRWKISLTGSIS